MDFLKDLFGEKRIELSEEENQAIGNKIKDALEKGEGVIYDLGVEPSTRPGSSNADELDIAKRERKKMKAINSSNEDELERIKKLNGNEFYSNKTRKN